MVVRKSFLGSLFLSLAACPLIALADPTYAMRLLPNNFAASDLNNKGQVVGTADDALAIWSDSELLKLPVLSGSPYSFINNRGDIAGTMLTMGQRGAVAYTVGMLHNINSMLPDQFYASHGFGINDNGTVVGTAHPRNGNDSRAFICKDGEIEILGTLGGDWSNATAVSESGYVAGHSHIFGSSFTHRAFLYKHGSMQDLGTLGGDDSEATAVNNAGQVVGASSPNNLRYPTHPFLFTSGRMIDLGTLGGNYGRANGN